MVPTPAHTRPKRLRGFSLVELSVVVAIISVVAALGLEAAATFVNRSATAVSREKLQVVDEAIDKFFRIYGRLPCPAIRSYDPANYPTSYGLEVCSSPSVTILNNGGIGNGAMVGAVPFRTLNLPQSASLDGFGSKIIYLASQNLTIAGGGPAVFNRFNSSGGTTTQNGLAAIEVRTGVLEQPCNTTKCQVVADPAAGTGAAYFAFSPGPDQRGAYNVNGVINPNKTCAISTSTEYRVDAQNCVFGNNAVRLNMVVTNIPYNVFYDNRFNPGLNLVSYFDDVAIWRTKAQL